MTAELKKFPLDEAILPTLRENFKKSIVGRKYGVDLDKLIEVVHPANGNRLEAALDLFTPRISLHHLGSIYNQLCGPAIPGCQTVADRRSYMIEQRKIVTFENLHDLTPTLREFAKSCLKKDFVVKTVQREDNAALSVTKLSVNDYICKIYSRSEPCMYHGDPYISYLVYASSLRKTHFTILNWDCDSYEKAKYFIPSSKLSRLLKSLQGKYKRINLNIPLSVSAERGGGRPARINWEDYKNKIDLLRRSK